MVKKRNEPAATKAELIGILQGMETRLDAKFDGLRVELKTDIVGLQEVTGELKADIGGLKTDISGLKASYGELKTDIGGLKTDISGLKASYGELKTDIGGLKTDISGLKASYGELKTDIGGLKTDISGLKASNGEIKADISSLNANVHRLNLEYSGLIGGMHDLKEGLTKHIDSVKTEAYARMEAFTFKMETLWRETQVYPVILDEHRVTLGNHDRRISALETRRSTEQTKGS